MIRELIRMNVDEENLEQAMDTMRMMIGRMISDSGCSNCNLNIEVDDGFCLSISSEWRDQLCHHHYTRSDTFMAILHLLDLSVSKPQVKYEVITGMHGLEYVSQQHNKGDLETGP